MTWIDNLDKNIIPYINYEGYDCRYPSIDPLYLEQDVIDELRNAGEQLFKIFVKVSSYINNKFLKKMEIPDKLIPYFNIPNKLDLPTWLSRFDFVFNKNYELKMVELNADTPCAIPEAFYGNTIAANYFKAKNPNENSYKELQSFLLNIANKCSISLINKNFNQSSFLFACFADWIEDLGNTRFLFNTYRSIRNHYHDNAELISFRDLKVNLDGSLVTPSSKYISTIYRLHPMELLIDEKSTEDEELGLLFLEGYKAGKFNMFNPPEALVIQSKGFLAFLYMLANTDNSIITQYEKDILNKYLAPSYFEDDKNNIKGKYVIKPIWGREGKGIRIVDNNEIYEKEIYRPEDIYERESRMYLYQEYIEQPKQVIKTDYSSDMLGYITLSVFMLGKEPSAVYSRFSYDAIAGNEAFWTPILSH